MYFVYGKNQERKHVQFLKSPNKACTIKNAKAVLIKRYNEASRNESAILKLK